MDIKNNLNLENSELRVNGSTGVAGVSPVSRGPGLPTILDSTHKEWEDADGSKVEVRDLTTQLRREGNVGTQGLFSDSAGNTPDTINASTILRTLYAKKIDAAGTFRQYWHHPESILCHGTMGDATTEATAANCLLLAKFPVVMQGFVWQISFAGVGRPNNGGGITAPEYLITLRAASNDNLVNSWPAQMVAGDTVLAPVVDLRTNVNAPGEHLSTVVVSPGQYFGLELVNANGTINFPTAMTLTVIGAGVRRGNIV